MEKQKEQAVRASSSGEKVFYAGLGVMAGAAGIGTAWVTADGKDMSEQESPTPGIGGEEAEHASVTSAARNTSSRLEQQAEEVTVTAVQTAEELEESGMEVLENGDGQPSDPVADYPDGVEPDPTSPEESHIDAGDLHPQDDEPFPMELQDEDASWMDDACDQSGVDMPLEFA